MMRSVFPMLFRHEAYRELGANYFDEQRQHYTVDRLARRNEASPQQAAGYQEEKLILMNRLRVL
jgi:hypothetical protein